MYIYDLFIKIQNITFKKKTKSETVIHSEDFNLRYAETDFHLDDITFRKKRKLVWKRTTLPLMSSSP